MGLAPLAPSSEGAGNGNPKLLFPDRHVTHPDIDGLATRPRQLVSPYEELRYRAGVLGAAPPDPGSDRGEVSMG